jgi:hypothetical protein
MEDATPTAAQQPDDRLFKAVFKTPSHVEELLSACAPQQLLAALDLRTLRLTSESFVDEQLAASIADIVMECQTASAKQVLVSMILEHKAFMPSCPPYQIMRYQHRLWSDQMEKTPSKPTPSVPVLVYHGKASWKVKPWSSYLDGWDDAFVPFTPPGGYVLIDLSELPDEHIRRFRSSFLRTALLLMKHRLEPEYLLTNLLELINFVESDGRLSEEERIGALERLLRYLQSLKSLKWKEVRHLLQPLYLTNQAMSVLEEIKLEMREEVREGNPRGNPRRSVPGRQAGRQAGRQG